MNTHDQNAVENLLKPGRPGFVPPNTKATAHYHTHDGPDPEDDSEDFSTSDSRDADGHGIDGYVGTPSENLKRHDYKTERDGTIKKVKAKLI
nr:DUF4329 domain-containing protein [Acidovorax sp. Leaf78]